MILDENTVPRLVGRVEHCLLAPELFQASLGEGDRVARRFQQAIPKVNFERTRLEWSLGKRVEGNSLVGSNAAPGPL